MLGRMPSVTDSIKTLRAYGGHLAIVTQTIPALDKIYGEDTRLSLQGGAGVKIYLAPSEQRTKSELSAVVGKTTHRVTSKSRTIGKGPFAGINISERSEDRDLLTEDEAGRLHEDTVIILANGQHPIKARRIKYFDDRVLKPIFLGQKGQLPAPDPKDAEIRDLRGDLVRTTFRLDELTDRMNEGGKGRSRVKSALSSIVLVAPDDKEKAVNSAATKSTEKTIPVVVRRRKANNIEEKAPLLEASDEAVKLLVHTASRVKSISAEGDGEAAAVEAA